MRRAGNGFLDHPLYLPDLFHQVQLGGQAPGRVGEHDVDAARARGLDGVENHCRGVALFLAYHDDVVALAPDLQLLACGGAEGVARRQQHRQALRLIEFGEFADGGGLACAVHAREHEDERFVRRDVERRLKRHEHVDQRVLECGLQLRCVGEALAPDFFLQDVEQMLGGVDADIGGDKDGLQLLVQFGVDLAADAEQAGKLPAQAVARLGEPGLEALCPARAWRRDGFLDGRGRFRCQRIRLGDRDFLRGRCGRIRVGDRGFRGRLGFGLEETKHGSERSAWQEMQRHILSFSLLTFEVQPCPAIA